MKHYDVTLNSNTQSVLNNAGPSFGSYDKKKSLRFYIQDKSLQGNFSEQQGDSTTICFCLIKGNLVESEKSIDIKVIRELKFSEFENKVREMFSIDPTILLKYKNMKDGTFLSLNDSSSTPYRLLTAHRVTKVGVYVVYEAGGASPR